MMRTGVDALTGKVLTGWDHCVQSIGICLTTRRASRILRRHLGSGVLELQDENADADTIFRAYIAIVDALSDPDGGEPGFNLRAIELVENGRSGRFVFLLTGDFYPRGHLGDFSAHEARSVSVNRLGAVE